MNIENYKLITSRFRSLLNIYETDLQYGIQIMDGWVDTLYEVLVYLQELDESIYVTGIKEYLGALYISVQLRENAKIEKEVLAKALQLCNQATSWSYNVCQSCGCVDQKDNCVSIRNISGWITTLCDKCTKQQTESRKNW